MPYCLPDHGIYFVHVPKTGGHWVLRVFQKAKVTVRAMPSRCGVDTAHGPAHLWVPWEKRARAFAFVRHPVQWYWSFWRYMRTRWQHMYDNHPYRMLTSLSGLESDDYLTFVQNVTVAEPAIVTRLYEWILGPEGAARVGHVGKYETLVADMYNFMGVLGVDEVGPVLDKVEPQNVSPHWDHVVREEDVLEAERLITRSEVACIRRFYEGGTPL